MRPRYQIIALSFALLLGATACHHGPKAPKQSKNPAAELEIEYRGRWIFKRTAELVATGLPQAEAQAKAEAEYAESYKYAIRNK